MDKPATRRPPRSFGHNRGDEWRRIARERLGLVYNDALVQKLLYWIDDDDLAMALGEVGAIKSSYGKLITVEEMASDCLRILKENLP